MDIEANTTLVRTKTVNGDEETIRVDLIDANEILWDLEEKYGRNIRPVYIVRVTRTVETYEEYLKTANAKFDEICEEVER